MYICALLVTDPMTEIGQCQELRKSSNMVTGRPFCNFSFIVDTEEGKERETERLDSGVRIVDCVLWRRRGGVMDGGGALTAANEAHSAQLVLPLLPRPPPWPRPDPPPSYTASCTSQSQRSCIQLWCLSTIVSTISPSGHNQNVQLLCCKPPLA